MTWTAESAEKATREMIATGAVELNPSGNPAIVKAALHLILGAGDISWERVAESANYCDEPVEEA